LSAWRSRPTEARTAVRVFLDPEHPDKFDGPTDAEISARRSVGVQVTEVNVVLDDGTDDILD